MTGRFWRFVVFIVIPLIFVGLLCAKAARDRQSAVQGGPGQATISYGLTQQGDAVDLVDQDQNRPSLPLRARAWGPLSQAKAIAVLVPGVGHSASEFDQTGPSANGDATAATLPEQAKALLRQANDPELAVVAWLGYQPPADLTSAIGASQIQAGAANLMALEDFLVKLNPDASITWICHSYGSLICASALYPSSEPSATASQPTAVALLGSPGVQTSTAGDLPTSAQIWAGRGSGDMIQWAGLLDLVGGGFGPDPTSNSFGARPIACDPGARHSDYFQAGSIQLAALASIATGDATNA
ncbi:MAG: alpha/beta hydrolase family protein [Micrococcales bacterium]|nr:alpha/beta hydrolase family protein [Micrococcales bacterium]